MCGFSPGSLKLKLRGSRQTGHSASSSGGSLEDTIGIFWVSWRRKGREREREIWEACGSSVERRERADAEAGEPKPMTARPLFFFSEEKTDLIEAVIEGTFGTERGEVYAEGDKDGRGRNRCFSGSSTGFLNIQLVPAIVMENVDQVRQRLPLVVCGVTVEFFPANVVVVVRNQLRRRIRGCKQFRG